MTPEDSAPNTGDANSPVAGGDPYLSPRAVDEPRKQRSLSRIGLVLLLLAVIAMFAFDVFCGRLPQSRAYQKVVTKLPQQRTDDSLGLGGGGGRKSDATEIKTVSAQDVHDLLQRQPDVAEQKNLAIEGEMVPVLVETYRFPGIIKSYPVVVTYLEDDPNEKHPLTALKFVRKQ